MSDLNTVMKQPGDQASHQDDQHIDFLDLDELSGTNVGAFDSKDELDVSPLDFDIQSEPPLAQERTRQAPKAEPSFDDDDEIVASDDEPKRSSNLPLIIGGVVIAILAFGGLGIFAKMVVFKTPQARQASVASVTQNNSAVSDVQIDTSAIGFSQPSVQKQTVGGQEQSQVSQQVATNQQLNSVDQAINSANGQQSQEKQRADDVSAKNLLITQGIPQSTSDASSQNVKPSSTTDEEALYDKALSSVENMQVPAEAVRIDPAVIQRQLAEQKVGKMQGNLQSVQDELGTMKGLVHDMQSTMSVLNQKLETNQSKQNAMEGQIAKLTEAVTSATAQQAESSAQQAKELEALKAEIKGVAARAAKAEETAATASKASAAATVAAEERAQVQVERPAPVKPAPVQRAEAPKPQVAQQAQQAYSMPVSTNVQAQQPVPTPRQVQEPREVASSAPEQCSGSNPVVSGVWRVKGVSRTAAYIVRAEDDAGIYLRASSPVPGFGVVVSFDPNSRSVCTTSGLIRR